MRSKVLPFPCKTRQEKNLTFQGVLILQSELSSILIDMIFLPRGSNSDPHPTIIILKVQRRLTHLRKKDPSA